MEASTKRDEMEIGIVIGTVVASKKDPKFDGLTIRLIQPVDKHSAPLGTPIVGIDGIGADEGQLIYYETSREGGECVVGREVPTDVGIVGIVDNITLLADKTKREAK